MKNILTLIFSIALAFILNFGFFLVVYRKLVFPKLEESERMESAPTIFSFVLIGFLIIAIISSLLARQVMKKHAQQMPLK